MTTPYAHSVNDSLVLAGFYAWNRPIYQNPKSDAGYAFGFSRSIRSHCGLMVDGHIKKDDWGRTGSVEPQFTDECRVRHDFNETVKFVAARSLERDPGVDQTRALMLTPEYLFDLIAVRGTQEHSYVWLVHTYGTAVPHQQEAWRASRGLQNLVPQLSDVRTLDTGGRGWSVTVRQTPPADPPENTPLGEQWWNRKIGVRVHMLGQPSAEAHVGATPKPTGRKNRMEELAMVEGVTIVASLTGFSAAFAALHEPFDQEPQIQSFQQIAQVDDALAVRVKGNAGSKIDDWLMVRVGPQADQPVTLSAEDESFTFTGHAFLRCGDESINASGNLQEVTVKVGSRQPTLFLDGKPVSAMVQNGVLRWKK